MQVTASDISAAQNLTLIAKDIDLTAAQNTDVSHNASQSKSSGLSVGVTVNPVQAFKDQYKSSTKNDQASSTVGKVISHGEAVADAVTAARQAVVIQAGSKRASSSANESSSTARTSSLTAGNNLNIIATDGSINSQGTQMSADGNALLLAQDNINLDVAHNTQTQDTQSKASGWGFDNRGRLPIGTLNNKANGQGSVDTITGTQLSVGGTTTLATTKGDIKLTAANIASNGDVNLNAARDLIIQSGTDTATNQNHSNNKAIGRVVISDTERFAGYHNEKHNDNNDTVTQVASNVASLNGNVNLNAGRDYVQTASNVLSNNEVNVTAQTITLNTADNQGTQHADDKALKVGAFARVSSPIIDLVNNVEAARKSDGRLQTMQGMAAAAQAYQTVSAAQSGKLISAEVGIGFTTNKSRDDAQYQTAIGSTIQGNQVNLTSTQGDIHATGAKLSGSDISLNSANAIILDASKSTSNSEGKRSGYGAEVGVGVSVGAQTGVYAYATAQASTGKYKSNATTYNNTELTGNTVSLTS